MLPPRDAPTTTCFICMDNTADVRRAANPLPHHQGQENLTSIADCVGERRIPGDVIPV